MKLFLSIYKTNDHLYQSHISVFLKIHERPVLNRNTRYIMGAKKKKKLLSLFVDIVIHTGSPCFRYCVCHVADFHELYQYYLTQSI